MSTLITLKKPAEIFIQLMIFFSVGCFTVETIPTINDNIRNFLHYAEIFIVSVFTIEYVLRIYFAPKKLAYVFSFYGIVDLLSIVPFYLSLFMSLSSLKILRLIRIVSIVKITRYNHALERLIKAFYSVKEELAVFMLFSFVTIYLASVGIYHFEHTAQPEVFKSLFDCLWWSVVTLTTVGYGDSYPITVGGRLFTFAILVVGLGLISIPTALIASALSSIKEKQDK